MNGQVRGLALELLREECVEGLNKASLPESSKESKVEAERACKLYDNALHGKTKDVN